MISYALASVFSLGLGLKSLGFGVLSVVTSAASCAMMAGSCATWVHTAEMFPTNVRATAHALLNAVSVIVASMSLSAAIAVACLPDTAGQVSEKSLTDGHATDSSDSDSQSAQSSSAE